MHSWVPVCKVNEVEKEDVIPFEYEGVAYAIYRSPDGDFFATGGHCTHEAELLCDGLVTDLTIECPKHNGRFDYTTGAALCAPVFDDLQVYPVKIENSTVYLEILSTDNAAG